MDAVRANVRHGNKQISLATALFELRVQPPATRQAGNKIAHEKGEPVHVGNEAIIAPRDHPARRTRDDPVESDFP